MSQYIQENNPQQQGIYTSSYDYSSSTANQSNYFTTQRGSVIRESSLSMNRNDSIDNKLMNIKPNKISENNMGGKIRHESRSVRNSVEFKENDPMIKNSIGNGNVNKLNGNIRVSMEMMGEYGNKNSYFNPLITKRNCNGESREKLIEIPLKSTTKCDVNNNNNREDNILERVSKLEMLFKENSGVLALHTVKLEKLEELSFLHEASPSQDQLTQSTTLTKTRHSRSITSSASSTLTPSFKELSDIMSLIEESKNYQIKNAEEYRKMIEEFRKTILEFREELNMTVKKGDIEAEMVKVKEIINNASGNINSNNTASINSKQLSRKPSTIISEISLEQSSEPILSKLTSELSSLKQHIERLEESSMSLRADLVKANVREKKFCEEVNASFGEANKKLVCLNKEILPFSEYNVKKGGKYAGMPICFKVCQELSPITESSTSCIPKPPALSKSTHIPSSSELEQNSPTSSSTTNGSTNLRTSQPNMSSSTTLSSNEMLVVNTKTYYIDRDGCLLDKDGFYLLNERSEQIKLSEKEIAMLKKMRIME